MELWDKLLGREIVEQEISSTGFIPERELTPKEIRGEWLAFKVHFLSGLKSILYQKVKVNKKGEVVKKLGEPYYREKSKVSAKMELTGMRTNIGWLDIKEYKNHAWVIKVPKKIEPIAFDPKQRSIEKLSMDYDEYDLSRIGTHGIMKDTTDLALMELTLMVKQNELNWIGAMKR